MVKGSFSSPLAACSEFHRLLVVLSSFVEIVNLLSALECLSDVSDMESECSWLLQSLIVWRALRS